jgi:hypothetical protein
MVPSAIDALDDLVIEHEDSLVDLSNLISSSKRFSDQESAPPVTRQERKFSSLYPSRREAEALEVVNASDILAKCCLKDNFEPRKPSSEIVRRSRWGSDRKKSSTLKDAVGQEYKTPPPGTYKCMTDPNNSPLEQGGYDCTPPASHRQSGNDVVQVEIAPGFFSPLRGSKETWDAISRGHSTNVDCFGCCTSLLCIADAEYVLCPDCKVVSPTSVADAMFERKPPAKASSCLPPLPLVTGGVGLGLRVIPEL